MNINTENLTPKAQQVLAYSRKKAEELKNSFVGTEHLLLAICDFENVAITIKFYLPEFDPDKLKNLLSTHIQKETPSSLVGKAPFSPRVKKIVALANKIAWGEFRMTSISPVHIFLGVLKEGDGIAARVLKKCGITYKAALGKFPEAASNAPPIFKQVGDLDQVEMATIDLSIVHTKKIDCKNGYKLTIRVLKISTHPSVNIFLLDLCDDKKAWQETFTSIGQVNAFIRGISAGATIWGQVLQLPGVKLTPIDSLSE